MARPSDQALVSDQAAARLDPPGFDPSRGPPRSPYLSTSKAHMAALASEFRLIQHRAEIMAGVSAVGLMQAPWPIRLAVWWRTKVRQNIEPVNLWRILFRRFPNITADFLEQTADWIEHGRDRYDPRSAGGFCQAEIDALYGFLLIDLSARDSDGPRMAETNADSARGVAGPARAEGIANPEPRRILRGKDDAGANRGANATGTGHNHDGGGQ